MREIKEEQEASRLQSNHGEPRQAPNDHAQLLARVEAATGPDREIDRNIHWSLGEWINLGGWCRQHKVTGQRESFTYQEPAPVTASLDATLALVERVLPGWCVENLGEMAPGCGELSGHWLCQLRPRVERRRMIGPITAENLRATIDATEPMSAPTPALALLAALLAALSNSDAVTRRAKPEGQS